MPRTRALSAGRCDFSGAPVRPLGSQWLGKQRVASAIRRPFDGVAMRSLLLGVLIAAPCACSALFPLEGYDDPRNPTSSAYVREVLADGPVLYQRFGERQGPTARDEIGTRSGTYAPRAALGSPGAVASDDDSAVTFDGTVEARVVQPPGLDFAGDAPFSVEIWARPTSIPAYSWVVDHQVYGATRGGWGLLFTPERITFERWANDLSAGVSWTVRPDTSRYQHVVAVFDGTRVLLYVDGVAVADEPNDVRLPVTDGAWTVGGQNCSCPSSNFVGSLDELAIYDKPLSGDRVRAHYARASASR